MTQSPELAGGAGFTYADQVATRYLAALLLGSGAPGLSERRVVYVALEQRDAGEPLDDIIADGEAPDGSRARLSLQVKREITISAAAENKDFRDIVRDSWTTMEKADFRKRVDRVGAVVGPSTAVGKWRDLIALAEFAAASDAPSDFAVRFAPEGSASKEHRAVLADLQKITNDLGRSAAVEDMHALLSHFVLIRFDALHKGAVDDPATITLLEQALAPDQAGQAVALAERLRGLTRRGAGTARSWRRGGLRLDIAPWFRLAADRWLSADIERLMIEVRLSASSISDKIGEATLDRLAIRDRVAKALAERQLVTLRGLPGSGKSVMLRREMEAALSRGPVLLLKADRLTGASWAQYATSLGMTHYDPSPLLREIAVLGTATVFIDGLDRIERAQRGIILDLMSIIEAEPELSNWRVLATLRNSGIEPVRTWLPHMFDGGRMASIDVGALDDDESETLAAARPGLRSLLFGPEPVRTLVRRPFFAKILDESDAGSGDTPRSEIELMGQWWTRGGFDADGGGARMRQRALLKLVRLRALQPDAPVALEALETGLLSPLEELVTDGVLEDTSDRHFVRFTHDIFFEWSFAQALMSAGPRWVEELKAAGEPPIIGRSLDLRAQAMFVSDPGGWRAALITVSDLALRSQWRRVWLLAPLNHPDFNERAIDFDTVMTAGDHDALRSAMVWFQAQHTTPNPRLLDGSAGDIADREMRLRAADLLGWPDDFRLWMRFLHYLDERLDAMPRRLVPHVLTLFEVWQNAIVDIPNLISTMIVGHAGHWLQELESCQPRMGRFRNRDVEKEVQDPWVGVQGLSEFESAVRRLMLRASRTESERVSAYLKRFGPERPASSKVFQEIMAVAPLLSQTHSDNLADFALDHFRRELPEDLRRRRIEENRRSAAYCEELSKRPKESLDWSEQMSLSSPNLGYWGPDRMEWDSLSLEQEPTSYFPASPLHQPFHALFENAPDNALRLVRSISNHAVESWQQLHRLEPDRGTPVPVEVEFPWGRQTFWGGAREYLWSRGLWAPKPLASAYLALDKWALEQVDVGIDGDALIERVVNGSQSIAALGIALHVALSRPAVTQVNEALITTQRLWAADIQRYVQEASIRSSSQIGFRHEHHRPHAVAVEALNTRAVRSDEIRALATLHVFQPKLDAAQRVRRAIQAFASSPDHELEEERNHSGARDAASEQARTYAAWGDLNHYRLVDVPEQADRQAIVMVNPIVEEPGVRERLEKSQEHLRTFALFHWAERSFKDQRIADGMTLHQGVASARALDDGTIFQPTPDDEQISIRRGAVAGAAAVVVAFAPTDAEAGWARDVLARAADCPEEGGPLWSSVSIVGWHHVIFIARAAVAELRRDPASKPHATALLSTLVHPLDNVGMETSGLLASLWGVAPHVCWVGLCLALDLCTVAPGEIGRDSLHDPKAGVGARQRKLQEAVKALELDARPLPLPPAPWVVAAASDRRRVDRPPDENGDGEAPTHWRAADGWWRSDRAGEILAMQPAKAILAAGLEGPFVAFCEAMLAWTIERRAPAWASRSREIDTGHVMEWTDRFADVLGSLVGLIEPRQAEVSFLQIICAIRDEDTCFDLLARLVMTFVCQHMLDSPNVASVASVVLDRSLDRLLAAPTFGRTGYRAGEMHGFSMPLLARWLMFVGVEHATLAHRFSNGDWSEIALILPTVDRFVRTAGWAPTIMSNFLTLVERAREHFPADAFADAVLAALSTTVDPGARWRGTMIAARIASRVQDIADRASPLPHALGQKLLRILDVLVDQGDRRSAALQVSPAFRDLRVAALDDPPPDDR